MVKIDLGRLVASAAKVAIPVVVGAALTHRSVKAAAIEAAKDAAVTEVTKQLGR